MVVGVGQQHFNGKFTGYLLEKLQSIQRRTAKFKLETIRKY